MTADFQRWIIPPACCHGALKEVMNEQIEIILIHKCCGHGITGYVSLRKLCKEHSIACAPRTVNSKSGTARKLRETYGIDQDTTPTLIVLGQAYPAEEWERAADAILAYRGEPT